VVKGLADLMKLEASGRLKKGSAKKGGPFEEPGTAVEKRVTSNVSARRRQELQEPAETQEPLQERGAQTERQS
jgi:hypothetical protein